MGLLALLRHCDLSGRLVPPERAVVLAQVFAFHAHLCHARKTPEKKSNAPPSPQVSRTVRACLESTPILAHLSTRTTVPPPTEVGERLLRLVRVAVLDLRGSRVPRYTPSFLGRVLSQGAVLVRLLLADSGLRAEGLAVVLAWDFTLPELAELELRRNTLHAGGPAVAEFLGRCPRLRALDLRETELSHNDKHFVLVGVCGLSQLRDLQLDAMPTPLPTNHRFPRTLEAVVLHGDLLRDWQLGFADAALSSAPNLVRLQLRGLALSTDGLRWLAAGCARWPHLRDVALDFHMLLCAPTLHATLIEGLAQCTALESLALDGVCIDSAAGTALGGLLHACTRLTSLRPGRRAGRLGLNACAAVAWTAPALRALDMHSMSMASDTAPGLLALACRAPNLVRLDLGGNFLSWSVASVITRCAHLEDLQCGFVSRNAAGFAVFAGYLARPESPLTRLSVLQCGHMRDYDTLLAGATQLRDLALLYGETGNAALYSTPRVLAHMTCLERLVLERMRGPQPLPARACLVSFRTSHVVASTLATADSFACLRQQSHLTALEMSSANLRPIVAIGLGSCLAGLPRLEILDLYGNALARVDVVLAAVSTRLRVLKLPSNELGDTGASDVAQALARLPLLEVRVGKKGVVRTPGSKKLSGRGRHLLLSRLKITCISHASSVFCAKFTSQEK